MHWDCFHKKKILHFWCKMCARFVSLFFCIIPKSIFSSFTTQESIQILRKYFCRPSGGLDEIKNYVQYPSNIPKYTTSNSYWMQNNIFFDIPCCMHKNLKIIIKICSTIFLLLAVIFPSAPLYWYQESGVHKTRKFVHDNAKKG